MRLDRLDNTGALLVQGELDEVSGSAISANGSVYRAGEFDEVTISPISGGLARRIHSNGKIEVSNYFDDYTFAISQVISSGLISYLDIQNYPGSGSTWTDASGNGNDATLVNTSYVSGPPPYMQFNGSAYGLMGNILSKTAYTKCAMIYMDTYYSNNIISGRNGDYHAFWLGSTTNLHAGHNGNWYGATGSTSLSLNQWYFVGCTFDTTNGFKLYVNGALDGTDPNPTTFLGADPGDCNVGAFEDNNNFYGRIPVAMVYNRVLSDAEIQATFEVFRGRFGI
ncbi:MAG: LamG domain-containing protein [Alphaproteobacteria bacterium]|nr:LamG domain-containing protein [Alphaproteobacteria bacterium]